MTYREDEYLLLSGIQHFKFCRRQWALIHIENQWSENFLTADGEVMHEKVHDKNFFESRKDLIVTRGMSIFSCVLGVSGECDALEFHRVSEGGVPLKGREGLWKPFPIEYKRGKPREDAGDTLQLCGQAMCLEEMLCCEIPEGALYYGELRHRKNVLFTTELREEVKNTLNEMHELYKRRHTPKVKPKSACNSCSLKELCLPKLMKNKSAKAYLQNAVKEII
ncbi:MAG: CRISPR-associated protein Cas4 [Clostridia bacterium]|nr:CRISPR-associated protein Cas4 [Clostridia bacterium]